MIKIKKHLLEKGLSGRKSLFFSTIKSANSILFPLIFIPIISRIFSVDQIGTLNYYLAIVGGITFLSSFSIPIIGSRLIAENKDNHSKINEIISTIFYLRVFILIVSTFILVVINLNSSNNYIFLFFYLLVISEFLSHNWVYEGLGNYGITTYLDFISKLVLLTSTFLFVKTKNDFYVYIYIYVGLNVLYNLFSFYYLFFKFSPSTKYICLKLIFKSKIIGVFLLSSVMSFFGKLDIVLIGDKLNKNDFAIYSNQIKLIMVAMVFITSWATLLIPNSLNALRTNDGFNLFYKKIFTLTLYSSILVSCNLFLFSDLIVTIVFGDKYINAAHLLRLNCFIIPFISLANLINYQVLYVNNDIKKLLLLYIIILLILCLFLFKFLPFNLYTYIISSNIISILMLLISLFLSFKHFDRNVYSLKMFFGLALLVLFAFIVFIIDYKFKYLYTNILFTFLFNFICILIVFFSTKKIFYEKN